jgi:hypothetical protein
VAAAIARLDRRLRFALWAVSRTVEAYVKMLGMAEPGPYLGEPSMI